MSTEVLVKLGITRCKTKTSLQGIDKIFHIACLEMKEGQLTGRELITFINPGAGLSDAERAAELSAPLEHFGVFAGVSQKNEQGEPGIEAGTTFAI